MSSLRGVSCAISRRTGSSLQRGWADGAQRARPPKRGAHTVRRARDLRVQLVQHRRCGDLDRIRAPHRGRHLRARPRGVSRRSGRLPDPRRISPRCAGGIARCPWPPSRSWAASPSPRHSLPIWFVLAALRFGVGAGAAFFFAPGLGLVASYFPSGSRGPVDRSLQRRLSVWASDGPDCRGRFGCGVRMALGSRGRRLGTAGCRPRCGGRPPADDCPDTRGSLVPQLWNAARPVLRSRPLWALSPRPHGALGRLLHRRAGLRRIRRRPPPELAVSSSR